MGAPFNIGRWYRQAAVAVLLALLGFGGMATPAAAGECVDAINGVHGDALVNRCNACRMVQVSHKRRGGGFPISRTYRIQPRDRMDLSFAGSGDTRVVADTPCDGGTEAEAQQSLQAPECAQLARRADGSLALVNTCTACRGVVLQRTAVNGRSSRQVFTMSGRSMLPIQAQGLAKLAIVSEIPCSK